MTKFSFALATTTLLFAVKTNCFSADAIVNAHAKAVENVGSKGEMVSVQTTTQKPLQKTARAAVKKVSISNLV